MEVAGVAIDAYRVNLDTGHDTGCCSFCGTGGRDTRVASVPDDAFGAPRRAFLDLRCAYGDRGGAIVAVHRYPAVTPPHPVPAPRGE